MTTEKPGKAELARMRAERAAWFERDRRPSRLAVERRRKRLEGNYTRTPTGHGTGRGPRVFGWSMASSRKP